MSLKSDTSEIESGQQLDFALVDEDMPRLKVAKANALIEAQYHLTSKEHRLLLAAMAKIRKDQTELHEQVFMVTDLAELLGISKSSAYSELRQLSAGLMKKQVEVRDEETGNWVLYQWVSKAYCRDGQFGIRFSDDLKPLLIGLVGRFTMYELGRVLRMRSNYSIRFYELFKQFEAFGTRTFSLDPKLTADKNWDDFSRVMGYDSASYPRFSNVNQRIIKPGLQEVRDLTEFKDIEVKLIRWKRKTVAVTFNFRSVETLEDLNEHPVFISAMKLGLSAPECRRVFADYDDSAIVQALSEAQAAHRERKTDQPAEYFLKRVAECDSEPAVRQKKRKPVRPQDAVNKQALENSDLEKHPLYKSCANDIELRRLISIEQFLGVPFKTYNEFHDHLMVEKQKRR